MSFKQFQILFGFSLLLIISNILSGVTTKKRIVSIHDPNLDIALLFDESTSMKTTNYKNVFEGVKGWIQGYYVGSTRNTRFAVVGCASTIPRLLLRYGTIAENVKYIPTDIAGSYKNVEQCFKIALNIVFQRYNGDRVLSPNVLFYITDCSLRRDVIPDDIAKQVRNEMLFFGIICVQVCDKDRCKLMDESMKPSIVKWLGYDDNKLITFTNASNFRHYLDKVLPTFDMEVKDCEYINVSSGCAFNVKNGQCESVFTTTITVPGYPPDYAEMCQVNESVVITECSVAECACDKKPWIQQDNCSMSCGYGIQIFRRNVSHNPTCPDIEERPCYIECEIFDQNRNDSANGTDNNSYAVDLERDGFSCARTIVGGVVGAAVVLIMINVLVIVLFYKLHRRGKLNFRNENEIVKFSKINVRPNPFNETNNAIELRDREESDKHSAIHVTNDISSQDISNRSLIEY